MENKFKLGVIGAGFMATSIIKGVINAGIVSSKEIIVNDVSSEQLKKVSALGVETTLNIEEIKDKSEFILFAVKPQNSSEVFEKIKTDEPLKLISIMAGGKIGNIKKSFPNASVARCMPNTPCSICEGAVGVDASDFKGEDREFIFRLLSSFAEVVPVPESKLGAVTGVSGSSPAYFYYFVKAIIDAGVKLGLSEEESKSLAVKTMEGSAKMIQKNRDKSLDDLITAVCSKGGTTIEAIKVFDELNLNKTVEKAVNACVKRSFELENGTSEGNSDEVVSIYTDGACSGNPGAGGYCAILIYKGTEKIVKGYEEETTNNRMELMGAIMGLSSLNKPCRVKLYSDSSYLVNGFAKGWVFDWSKNGWKTADKSDVKNVDLWEKLLDLYNIHNIELIKIKGHSDNEYNNRCDEIAVNEYKSRITEN